MSYGEVVSFIWSIADLIRDSFRRGEYQNVTKAVEQDILKLLREVAG